MGLILNGYTLETHVLILLSPCYPNNHIQALIQKTPLTFHEERVSLHHTLLWNRIWQSYKPSSVYKSGHCEFSIVNSSIFVSDPSPIPYFISRHLLSIMLKKCLLTVSFFQSCPKIFLLAQSKMIYRKYLSEHIIPAPQPTMDVHHP